MKTLLILFCILLFGTDSFSQSDLLVMKHKNQTIQTWVPGSVINFQFSSRQWIQGIIKKIHNDSILIEQISIVQVPNQFGFPTIDTAKLGLLQLHVNEIYGMPKKDYAGIITNGALLQLGSGAYLFLNLANSLIKSDPVFSSVNVTRLGVAGAVFLLGTLLHLSHKTYIILGKRYSMQTIRM